MDPVEFLKRHEPFSRLDGRGEKRLGQALEVVYARSGELLVSTTEERGIHLWIVRKGAVRLEVDGRPVDVLDEGEAFGFPSLLSKGPPRFDVVAIEDCLLYRIAGEVFHELVETHRAFGEYFVQSLGRRLSVANARESPTLTGDLMVPVERLVERGAVFIEGDATIGRAARAMRDERVGSVLVRGSPMGIVTDRDLRARVLAEGRGPETPVREVMSAPLKTVPAESPLFEALLFLLRERIHHLALERDGEVVGVVTHVDLMRHQIKSPGYVLKRIEKITDPGELAGYASEIAGMVETMFWSGAEATAIGHVVASLNDAVVQSLVRHAEATHGPPPCRYAWIVFGSEGRREQTLLTDQDNALVYEHDTPDAKHYFAGFSETVVRGLIDASFPPCAGGFMATNWHRPLSEWQGLYERWTSTPDPRALMEVANFFDHRAIHGALDVSSLQRRIDRAASRKVFLAHLAKASLSLRPPIGLFHRIRTEAGAVDLKAGGLMPIVGLARVHGLEAGTQRRQTLRRLEAAAEAGTLSREGADTLAEGFRFLFRLRLEAQLRASRAGRPVDHHVAPHDLSALDRRHLKETLLHIRTMQEAMSQRFSTQMLG